MIDDRADHIAGRRKEAEMHADLEHHGEQQATGIAARVAAEKRTVSRGKLVVPMQRVAIRKAASAWVSGALDGCHELSRKGCAECPAQGVRDQGVRG